MKKSFIYIALSAILFSASYAVAETKLSSFDKAIIKAASSEIALVDGQIVVADDKTFTALAERHKDVTPAQWADVKKNKIAFAINHSYPIYINTLGWYYRDCKADYDRGGKAGVYLMASVVVHEHYHATYTEARQPGETVKQAMLREELAAYEIQAAFLKKYDKYFGEDAKPYVGVILEQYQGLLNQSRDVLKENSIVATVAPKP